MIFIYEDCDIVGGTTRRIIIMMWWLKSGGSIWKLTFLILKKIYDFLARGIQLGEISFT